MRMQILRSALAPVLLVAIPGCNQYEVFRVAGYEQASYSNEADILFVVDNSASMYEEASSLGLNFNTFIDNLVDPESGSVQVTETLEDAVGNYVQYVTDRGRFLDYQLGITTTSADPGDSVVDPGEAGTLVGPPYIISEDRTGDVAEAFRENLLCDTTAWPGACEGDDDEDCIPYDPNFECGDDPGDQITWEYLECVCGSDWNPSNPGSGTEEGFEAVYMALCRAVENPPAGCYDELSPFEEGEDELTNEGLIRDGAATIVVIVTDEGDNSRRLSQGTEDPEDYLELFDEFDTRLTFVVVGPNYDPDERTFTCNSGGGTTWGTLRYQYAADRTGGFYNYIETEVGDECEQTDFSAHLEDLGDLLNNLLNIFPLQAVPDPDTLVVFVDDVEIAEAEADCDPEATEATSDTVACDGWLYDPSDNAVTFYGSAIPDYNAEVRIFYRPLSDMPRSLPF